MASLFISYAHEDFALAERLAGVLENCGHRVWWDRRLLAGSAFTEAIENAIHDSDHLLVLWSKNSTGSSWVRDEAAMVRDCRKLVPLSSEIGFGIRLEIC